MTEHEIKTLERIESLLRDLLQEVRDARREAWREKFSNEKTLLEHFTDDR
jgi:hypothetical protein